MDTIKLGVHYNIAKPSKKSNKNGIKREEI